MKKYVVSLSEEERRELDEVIESRAAAYKRTNAQILLKADVGENGPGWKDKDLADAFDVSVRKVERLRKRLCEQGLERALTKAKGGGRSRKLDGNQEAQLIALTCSEAPEGRAKWTLRLLADRMVALDYVDEISYESIRRVLKKRDKTMAEKGVVHSPESEC